MEIIATVLNFFLDLLKPLRNLILIPLQQSRGFLHFYIDKYYDLNQKDKKIFTLSSLCSIDSNYSDEIFDTILLSHKLSPKQIDFLLNFFLSINNLITEYNMIKEKLPTLRDGKVKVFGLPEHESIILEYKKDDIILEYFDSYFASSILFCEKYYEQEKFMFFSILTTIDKITKFKKSDKSALVNEYQAIVKIYDRITNKQEYSVDIK